MQGQAAKEEKGKVGTTRGVMAKGEAKMGEATKGKAAKGKGKAKLEETTQGNTMQREATKAEGTKAEPQSPPGDEKRGKNKRTKGTAKEANSGGGDVKGKGKAKEEVADDPHQTSQRKAEPVGTTQAVAKVGKTEQRSGKDKGKGKAKSDQQEKAKVEPAPTQPTSQKSAKAKGGKGKDSSESMAPSADKAPIASSSVPMSEERKARASTTGVVAKKAQTPQVTGQPSGQKPLSPTTDSRSTAASSPKSPLKADDTDTEGDETDTTGYWAVRSLPLVINACSQSEIIV